MTFLLKIATKRVKEVPPTPLPGRGFSLLLLLDLKSLRDWLRWQSYLISHALQTPDQLLLDFAMIRMPRKKGYSFLVILLTRFHHLGVNHQDAMAHGQCCSFPSAPFFEPTILLSQGGARATNAMRRLDQRSSQIPISFSRSSTESFSCTLRSRLDRPPPRSSGATHQENVRGLFRSLPSGRREPVGSPH